MGKADKDKDKDKQKDKDKDKDKDKHKKVENSEQCKWVKLVANHLPQSGVTSYCLPAVRNNKYIFLNIFFIYFLQVAVCQWFATINIFCLQMQQYRQQLAPKNICIHNIISPAASAKNICLFAYVDYLKTHIKRG